MGKKVVIMNKMKPNTQKTNEFSKKPKGSSSSESIKSPTFITSINSSSKGALHQKSMERKKPLDPDRLREEFGE